MRLKCLYAIALPLLLSTLPAQAAEKREALYDAVVDFNRDGVADRAVLVLVGPGRTDFGELTKERYGLSDGERVELAIYFGAGATALDISKPADVSAEHVLDPALGDWVLPLEATGAGSLRVMNSSGWGSSNESDTALTLAWRNGVAQAVGYTVSWDTRAGIGSCDINMLSGKAVLTEGADSDGRKKKLKGHFKPVPLANWSEKTRPKVCDDVG